MTRRLILVAVVAVLGVLAGPLASAVARPLLAIELPQDGSVSNETQPLIVGQSSDIVDPVVVRVYGPEGEVQSAETTPSPSGEWSVRLAPALADGTYQAIAEQTEQPTEETATSAGVGFTVDTASPTVELNAVASPSGEATPAFSGTASDTESVSILIYRGSEAAGEPAASAAATGTGGSWVSGHASPTLTDGEYTAVAEQESSLGNPPGRSKEVTFLVDTRSPEVTLDQLGPSNNARPSFQGEASDSTPVAVKVFDAEGHEVASASATPSGGEWTSAPISHLLASGSYTAVATEPSSIGNPAGESAPITFLIDTEAPDLTLNQPAARSAHTRPSFSGTASDTTAVTVDVFKGAIASGTPVATVTAGVADERWSSGALAASLLSGTYTARAEAESSFAGNPKGFSEARTFVIDTSSPSVSLAEPKSPTNSLSPVFHGTASESSQVVIHVLEGAQEVAHATATPSGGVWTSGPLSAPLAAGEHQYKVLATEVSTIENKPGESEAWPLVVDTNPPEVGLAAVASLSNDSTPSFAGSSSEGGQVTVSVYAGSQTTGTSAASTTTATVKSGSWTSSPAEAALPDGSYTAVARQSSALGNGAGESNQITFTVNTSPPKLTLTAVPTPSNKRNPSFSGTVKDVELKVEPVTVHVYDETGAEVSSVGATITGTEWHSPPLARVLAEGEHGYTAVATQASSLGNEEGKSKAIPFAVDTTPPEVTLDPVAAASSARNPTFEGTTTQQGEGATAVKVSVYRGNEAKGTPVALATAIPEATSSGVWSWHTASLSPELEDRPGTYTAVARQESTIGNGPGASRRSVFYVDPELPILQLTPVRAQLDAATPSFTGTSNQSQPVSVQIYARRAGSATCEAEGEALSSATAPVGGAWATGSASPALADGEYAAIAYQGRAIPSETQQAQSRPSCFAVDTRPPVVTLTAPFDGSVFAGSSVTVAGAGGTAPHDSGQATVQLFSGEGIAADTTPAQQIVVNVAGGAWSAVFGALAPGSYTARAEQADEAGNVGVSTISTFHVAAEGGVPSGVGPSGAFSWYPARPHTGEPISLVSDSVDATSQLTGYAWSSDGAPFVPGSATTSKSFLTPGNHVVRLKVLDAAGRNAVASETIPVTYPLMRPFPVVRIVTTRTVGRVRVEVLSVRAPVGATVEVSCSGNGCPLRSQLRKVVGAQKASAPVLAFARFERSLAPGVSLRIRVFKAGMVGKYTLFTIRREKLPVRSDSCVSSTESKPVRCPA